MNGRVWRRRGRRLPRGRPETSAPLDCRRTVSGNSTLRHPRTLAPLSMPRPLCTGDCAKSTRTSKITRELHRCVLVERSLQVTCFEQTSHVCWCIGLHCCLSNDYSILCGLFNSEIMISTGRLSMPQLANVNVPQI